jgi:2-methylcitrate dehydratase PrpD
MGAALEELAALTAAPPAVVGDDVVRSARPVLDTLTVAMAGRREPVVELARTLVATAPGSEARDWATGATLSVEDAAFVNGVTSHALDLDDISMAMSGHPSTLLVPVTVAMAEAADREVVDLLAAYVVGLRVNVAVSAGFDLFAHYNRGWHASVTVGTLGATAAAAALAGLSETQSRNALGLAISMASGTRQNFGTMTKPVHIGLAAHNAVRAVKMAGLGLDSSRHALEGPIGFYALYGASQGDSNAVLRSLRQPASEVLATLSTKRHPCCYQTHRAVDAAQDVREALGDLEGQDVERVLVTVNPDSDTSLIHPFARTPIEARFCMRYVVAAALLDGVVDFASFTEEAVLAPEVQELMGRIDLDHAVQTPHQAVDYSLDYATVEVRTRDGRAHHVTCTAPRGNAERPLTTQELVAKGDSCLVHGAMTPGATGLLERLQRPGARVRDLLDALRDLDPGTVNPSPAHESVAE